MNKSFLFFLLLLFPFISFSQIENRAGVGMSLDFAVNQLETFTGYGILGTYVMRKERISTYLEASIKSGQISGERVKSFYRTTVYAALGGEITNNVYVYGGLYYLSGDYNALGIRVQATQIFNLNEVTNIEVSMFINPNFNRTLTAGVLVNVTHDLSL